MATPEAIHLPIYEEPAVTAKPQTRKDCEPGGMNEQRPCCQTWCPYFLASASSDDSCVLDLADRGGMTLEEVGDILGVTRERVRQIEHVALRKLAKRGILLTYRTS